MVRSNALEADTAKPFRLKFNCSGRHPAYATLLGTFNEDGSILPPAVLHIPGQRGSPEIRLSSDKAGSDDFQVYENGGASANHAYFVIAALYKLGRKEEGDRIPRILPPGASGRLSPLLAFPVPKGGSI